MSDFNINFRVEGAEEGAEEIKQLTGETEKLSKTQEQTTKKVQSYKSQIKDLRLELVKLGERTKENADQYDNLSDRIRELDDAQEDLVIGTSKLDDQLGSLPGPIGKASQQFKVFDIALKNVRGAKVQLIKQFPILKNAIAATGIGALVIIFGLLVAAVIKAFNSFKPLQDAVGRLGVAFNLVFKLVEPLIELIGKGLVRVVDAAAKGIAFLTGSLKEYNDEIQRVAAQDKLNEKLEYEAQLWELQKDKFDEYTRSKLQAYRDNLDRFKEIDQLENLSNTQKNELKKASNQRYYRELERAEKMKSDRDKENAKIEQERFKKLNELTQDQINKLKELQDIQVKNIKTRINLLKEREIEGLGDIKNIEKLRKSTEFWEKVLKLTTNEVDNLQKSLEFLEPADPGFEALYSAQLELGNLFIETLQKGNEASLEGFEVQADIIFDKLMSKGDIFVKDIREPFKILTRDFENVLKTMIDLGITSQDEFFDLSESIRTLETMSRIGTLEQERKATEDFEKQKESFLKRFVDSEVKKYTEVLKKSGQFNENQQKQLEQTVELQKENFRSLGEQAFETFTKNILIIRDFSDETLEINRRIKELDNLLEQSSQKGELKNLLDEAITKDLPKFVELIENVDKQTKGATGGLSEMVAELSNFIVQGGLVGFPIEKGMSQAGLSIEKVKELFQSLDSRFKISDETATQLINNMVEKRIAADIVLKQLNTEYLASDYDRQLASLENQRKIDEQRLRDKQATEEQLLKLQEIYTKKRERLEGQYTLYVMEQTGQIFSLVSDLLHEGSTEYKFVKYFEALISAITSSVKAYESALAYGGPAGPILAPILGAATFAVQQKKAFEILSTPDPPKGDYKELGGEIFGPRHSQGGVMLNAEGGEFVINRRAMMNPFVSMMAPMLNQMNENSQPPIQPNPPIKTYVLTGDLISQEKADKRIQDLARF